MSFVVSRLRLVLGVACAAMVVLLVGCASGPQSHGQQADVAAVKEVVEAFRIALRDKDKPKYLSLFFSAKAEQIGWQAVVDDPKLQLIQRDRPQAIKARHNPANNFLSLIDSAIASATTEEEQISKVVVDTDGEIASAAFDYVYLSAGKPTNRGREQWQLVRTEQGWKIFSVIYTVRDPVR